MRPDPGVYVWTHGAGGVSWYRQREPLRVATHHGVRTDTGPTLSNAVAESFDTILVHMLWDERASQGWRALADRGHHRLVLDIDDAQWEPDWEPFRAHYQPEILDRVRENVSVAHVVTTPSPAIAAFLRGVWGHPNVHVVPNTVPEWLLSVQMPDAPVPARWRQIFPPQTIGYQGSPSHAHDWAPGLREELLSMLDRHPSWGMAFWGPNDVGDWPPDRTAVTGWNDSVRDYYLSLSMDIGLGPLKDTYFNRCKSGLRAVEYAALGIPAVLPLIPPYHDPETPRGIGQLLPGRTGMATLAHTDAPGSARACAETTRLCVEALVQDPDARQRMGEEARKVAAAWTTEENIDLWVSAWNSA